MLVAGICLSFLGSILMALWALFAIKMMNGHLAVAIKRSGLLMLAGRIGFPLLCIGFLLQLIHACF